MYLNVYVPILQTAAGVAHYIRQVLQKPMASTALLAPKSKGFVQAIDKFVRDKGIDVVRFGKGQRKDDITQQYLQQWGGREGVMYVGKAQEKTRTIRTYRKVNPETGQSYPWLHDTTARVNHYYFYCRDEDFGPIFIKFGSYFPYNAKLCINGHEYLKCQLDKEGIEYEALDNGIRSCENPERAQQIADELSAAKIDALMRKWLRRLPHPFSAQDSKTVVFCSRTLFERT
jgi:hypothetical protein